MESKIGCKWTYLQNRNRFTDIENRLVAKGEGCSRGEMEWEFGISRCKLSHIGWINNEVLLYSTGSYIQDPVINHNGEEVFKRMYESESETVSCSVMYDSLWPPWTVAHQTLLFMEFSRQAYWSGWPFLSPGDLSNPGIRPGSPSLHADSLPSESPGNIHMYMYIC